MQKRAFCVCLFYFFHDTSKFNILNVFGCLLGWIKLAPKFKDFQDIKLARVVEEVKQTYTEGSFLHRIESLKNGKCVLESPLKVLEFFVQKVV